jgi:putative aminopeptidase FrvX
LLSKEQKDERSVATKVDSSNKAGNKKINIQMAKTVQKKKTIITDQSFTFLKNYINNASPVGFETWGQKLWLEYLRPFVDTHYVDAYGTAVGVINPDNKFKVVIEAHADEISWFVNYVTPEGLIYLKRNGGVDHQTAPASRVFIHGKKGTVKAVFGWPAIHTRMGGEKETIPKTENLWLDCGARNRKEVEALGIHIGAVVTYQDGFDELANGNYIGRAFDNRIGGFMIAEVARLLKENKKKLSYGLYIVNAVQEEIGLRGAEMIARRIKPDIAIVTDVTHDTTTPLINKNIEGDVLCGKGPSLSYAPAVHNKLLALVEKVAADKKINVQWRALSRSTGTDTDSFAYSNEGCPSVLISIPLRYMHTTVEMLHRDDIEGTIQLMYETLLTLTPKTNLSYM